LTEWLTAADVADIGDGRPLSGARRLSGEVRSMEFTVTLTVVPLSQRQVIAKLIQLYKYDFSEIAEIGSPYGEVGSDGRYSYEGLDSYWREEGRLASFERAVSARLD
jgi:hypothetical protein